MSLFGSLSQEASSLGLAGIFGWMTLESALIPLPSEIVMPLGGYLAWQGSFSLTEVVVVGALGNLVGSLIVYWLGRRYGREWLLALPFVRAREVEHAERCFARYGLWASF